MKNYISVLLTIFLLSCSEDSDNISENRYVFENNTNQVLDSILFVNNLNSEKIIVKNIQDENRVEGLLKCDNDLKKEGKYKIVVYKSNQNVASKEFGSFNSRNKNVSFYITLDEDFIFEVEEF